MSLYWIFRNESGRRWREVGIPQVAESPEEALDKTIRIERACGHRAHGTFLVVDADSALAKVVKP